MTEQELQTVFIDELKNIGLEFPTVHVTILKFACSHVFFTVGPVDEPQDPEEPDLCIFRCFNVDGVMAEWEARAAAWEVRHALNDCRLRVSAYELKEHLNKEHVDM